LGNSGCVANFFFVICTEPQHSAIHKSKQHPEDFISDFFKKEDVYGGLQPSGVPIPGEDLWVKTTSLDIDPPIFQS
jgi:hypothetical protein